MKFIGTETRLTVQASALVMTLEQLTEMSSISLTGIEETLPSSLARNVQQLLLSRENHFLKINYWYRLLFCQRVYSWSNIRFSFKRALTWTTEGVR